MLTWEDSCCIFLLILTLLPAICHCPLLEKPVQSCQASRKENQTGILKMCNVIALTTFRSEMQHDRDSESPSDHELHCSATLLFFPLLLWDVKREKEMTVEGHIWAVISICSFFFPYTLHIDFQNSFLAKAVFFRTLTRIVCILSAQFSGIAWSLWLTGPCWRLKLALILLGK